jgi:DNA-binding transcriptional MerR regulator
MAMPERTKSDATKLYYSISEVAELVNVKPHVLRYWETQFKMLRPRKNRAGNRSYREREVQLALRIKRLLYDEGFTIAGARRKLLDERRSGQSQTELDFVGLSQDEFLGVLRRDLEGLLALVRGEKSLEELTAGESEVPGGLLREVGGMTDEAASGEIAGGTAEASSGEASSADASSTEPSSGASDAKPGAVAKGGRGKKSRRGGAKGATAGA